MATSIFVNLPVRDLNRSIDFFKQLGYEFNPHFTNEEGACMVISETIYVMFLVEKFFKTFITKEICDTSKSIESILCLSTESKEAVDDMINKAIKAGGSLYNEAKDHGFMYQHAFQDLDGHLWEIMWMDPSAVEASQN